jgi:hypothetical protein
VIPETGMTSHDDPDDDLFHIDDDAFTRPRRTNGWTRLIVAALVGVVGFGGGVLAQKSHDVELVSSGAFAGRARSGAGGPGGSGRGGAPGGAGWPGGPGGSGGSGGSGEAASADTALPAVVGTVTAVAAARLVVTNFAGTAVAVTITPTTTVTLVGTTSLATGLSASAVGTKAADGSVTATAITVRRAST